KRPYRLGGPHDRTCREHRSPALVSDDVTHTSALCSWIPDRPFVASGMTVPQNLPQSLRRDRQLGDRAGHSERVIDCGGDRGADGGGAALARAFEAEGGRRGPG